MRWTNLPDSSAARAGVHSCWPYRFAEDARCGEPVNVRRHAMQVGALVAKVVHTDVVERHEHDVRRALRGRVAARRRLERADDAPPRTRDAANAASRAVGAEPPRDVLRDRDERGKRAQRDRGRYAARSSVGDRAAAVAPQSISPPIGRVLQNLTELSRVRRLILHRPGACSHSLSQCKIKSTTARTAPSKNVLAFTVCVAWSAWCPTPAARRSTR